MATCLVKLVAAGEWGHTVGLVPYTWRLNCLSQCHPLWVLLRDIFQLDLGSLLSRTVLPPSRAGWQPRAGSSDSFLRICQYQNWQIPVCSARALGEGGGGGGAASGLSTAVAGQKSAPTSAIGRPSSAWQSGSNASPSGTITQAAQWRQPPRPRATLPTLHRVRAERETVVAAHLLLLPASARSSGSLSSARVSPFPSVCLTELEQALWPVSQMAMYSGCCTSIHLGLCWCWRPSAPRAGLPTMFTASCSCGTEPGTPWHSSCYMWHLALHLAIVSTQYSS